MRVASLFFFAACHKLFLQVEAVVVLATMSCSDSLMTGALALPCQSV